MPNTLPRSTKPDYKPRSIRRLIESPSTSPACPPRVWVSVYLFVLLAIWCLVGRYRGITHDSLVYLLQAVAELQPNPLGGDIFLLYRSQDEFTIFTWISARAVRLLGVDHAAAALTFLFKCAWFAMAWAIARRLQGPRLALLSLGLLLVIPGFYSAKGVFQYAETFMTARGLAEALALAALLAALYSRRFVAAALIVLALMVHPLMAFPVGLIIVLFSLPLDGIRHWLVTPILLAAGAVVGAYLLGLPDPFMRGDWLEVTRLRSSFLFTDRWHPADWEVAAQVLLTLLLGVAASSDGATRKLLAATLCVGAVGIALTVVSSQFELKILVQGQPWRWLWAGRFLSTALLPAVAVSLWDRGRSGQATAMLLASAWLLVGAGSYREVPPVGVGGILCACAAAIWAGRKLLSSRTAGLLAASATGVLTVVAAALISVVAQGLSNDFSFGRDPAWVQRANGVLTTSGIAATVATSSWYFLIVRQHVGAMLILTVAAACLLIGAVPESFRRWTDESYGNSDRAVFSEWRAQIPAESQVFWQGAAQAVWFLLDRRSYLTITQGAGTVFSSDTTAELLRRANVLAPLVPPGKWFGDPKVRSDKFRDLTAEILVEICVDPTLDFVVSSKRLPGSTGVAEWPGKADFVYLYACSGFHRRPTT